MSTPQQPRITDAHLINISSGAGAPVDGAAGNIPMYTLSPVTHTGLLTTGFLFVLKSPPLGGAVAGAGGFTLNWWVRMPSSSFWGSATPITGVNYGDAYLTFDVDAVELYLDIENVAVGGQVIVAIAEQ